MPTATVINRCDNCSIKKVMKYLKQYKKLGFTEHTVTEKPYKEFIFANAKCRCVGVKLQGTKANPYTAYHIEVREPAHGQAN